MRQITHQINVSTQGRKLYDITPEVVSWVKHSGFHTGLITLYIQHTSASLLINENYDHDVLVDMEAFFNRLVPDGDSLFTHTVEGPDDMPAHVRTALTQTHLSIPLIDGKAALGQWQGIFLYEHRHVASMRRVILHLIGE
ncbi:MAG: secondary thiamine-phosphate synthase enzyme YjbQ [Methylotenera sp.]|nr:secondary thiamine-phosphate synthase enzyme YjbQ [Methylotenera sp.]MDO9204980.1 secondary thiamine-phosphate synthase enzyme YjbQ [Methylotenera sp.]MDO9394334.1 secondary thiamine-phosphate synthase enzyme YjbQ [Methylotenera sp.]MDP1523529.1 secondary thiamine-phosphate synthase enzyme YjbQ [Methylotenera sp.]MDP2071168.1 secondary thiamine-phosphate synthase enzyme YjbQ [Methylotenera sp.]MDP2230093.1 secondary thiamine-phosphate synthase enzyme YjbQ [Methylotenera sp.]